MTMHRPSNVDEKQILEPLFNFLNDQVANDMPLIWPIHPRSQNRIQEFGLWEKALNSERLILLHPLDYHEMLRLNMDAHLMLTDSGGLQEESCVLDSTMVRRGYEGTRVRKYRGYEYESTRVRGTKVRKCEGKIVRQYDNEII